MNLVFTVMWQQHAYLTKEGFIHKYNIGITQLQILKPNIG